jgi:glycosyltransferase involved in cell wall biosynthesis
VLEKNRANVLAKIGIEKVGSIRVIRARSHRVNRMRLLISIDEHYLRDAGDGIYSSEGTTSYAFWEPYLQVFSHVIILARVKNEGTATRLRAEARADGQGVSFYPLPDFRGPLAYLQNRRQVICAVNKATEDADAFLLHGAGFVSGALAHILDRKRLRYALQVIGDPWEVFGKGGVGGPLRPFFRLQATRELRWVCRNAMAVRYVTGKTLQERYPANPSAFQTGFSDVQLNGALLDETQLAERICSLKTINERTPRLGFIGTLEQTYKGADVLLRGLASCARQGITLTCDLAGEGSLRGQYESLASQLGLGSTVRFLGRLPADEAIYRFLDSVDLFVMPSLTEGLPRAMVEAMARGCPAIGSRVGGIPELLSEECLFPAGDHERLAQMLLSKLNSEELCRMARMNLATAGHYAPTLMAEKHMEFLKEILARSTCAQNRSLTHSKKDA